MPTVLQDLHKSFVIYPFQLFCSVGGNPRHGLHNVLKVTQLGILSISVYLSTYEVLLFQVITTKRKGPALKELLSSEKAEIKTQVLLSHQHVWVYSKCYRS